MSEAKELPPELDRREPQLFDAELVVGEGPLATVYSSGPATLLQEPAKAGVRFSTHMLLFFLIGLVMFVAGAALAGALVTGLLDSYLVHLKDLLHHTKDVVP